MIKFPTNKQCQVSSFVCIPNRKNLKGKFFLQVGRYLRIFQEIAIEVFRSKNLHSNSYCTEKEGHFIIFQFLIDTLHVIYFNNRVKVQVQSM